MTKIKFSQFLLMVLLMVTLTLGSPYGFAELAVIVHPENNIQAITKGELKRMYMGVSKEFPNGLPISAIDQFKDSDKKKEFYKKVVSKGLAQISAYWSRRVFTGKGVPPRALKDDNEIKMWVASHPESIAYIYASNVDDSVKVIFNVK